MKKKIILTTKTILIYFYPGSQNNAALISYSLINKLNRSWCFYFKYFGSWGSQSLGLWINFKVDMRCFVTSPDILLGFKSRKSNSVNCERKVSCSKKKIVRNLCNSLTWVWSRSILDETVNGVTPPARLKLRSEELVTSFGTSWAV